jgi:diaminohydroxyphosphoribosylaminopyrimidine deaminase/5-amino-6-(5-phosphoribosylamino)uracil reductase
VVQTTDAIDVAHMQAALGLARRGLGSVWPNPAVGCVIVEGDARRRVVARGWTQKGGRPHAETEALARAGARAKGATVYVSLEPCSHHGQTPPCADALVSAGVKRVIVATEDSDPRVLGKGIARLRDAGVEVDVGLLEAEAREVNVGFFKRLAEGRPLITLKAATTLDGRIATASGESQWITGDISQTFGHRLRAENDAILVGIGTALADDPQLTCRLPGMGDRSPIRILLDSRLRLPLDSFLAAPDASVPTWIIATAGASYVTPPETFRQRGLVVIEAPDDGSGRPDVRWVAQEMGRRGLTRVLVEAGGKLLASWLRSGLTDRLAWSRAPKIIGGDGMPVTEAIGTDSLAQALSFTRIGHGEAGADLFEIYHRPD